MTIETAIETLSRLLDPSKRVQNQQGIDAIRLGIEAMQAYAQARRLGLPLRCEQLPGETDDNGSK